MVKAIGPVPSIKNSIQAAKDSATKIRLENLIKEFEECAKKQPDNKLLAEHILRLKEALKNIK